MTRDDEITARASAARRALRDAGINVPQAEAEAEIARRRPEESPLWCARCQTITTHAVDPRTLVDVCRACGTAVGDE